MWKPDMPQNPRRHFVRCLTVFLLTASMRLASVQAQTADYERPPIDYLNATASDPVSALAKELQSGAAKLPADPKLGYLPAVLERLKVPASSQTLVFSKTSLQLQRISPRRPRAIYFGDQVYVGYCQQGDVLELAGVDGKHGATFYTLEQATSAEPKLVRDRGGCLSCHSSNRTQNVPGFLVRSVFVDGAGHPKLGSGSFTTDHTSEFSERWGGWYVTGQHGSMRHMGNTICTEEEYNFDRETGANQTSLNDRFKIDAYLQPHSDLVALMVLEHQTQMHNALISASYETQSALFQSDEMNKLLERPDGFVSDLAERRMTAAAQKVVDHLLFANEFQLTDAVSGTSEFTVEFAAAGKATPDGRSLRQFNLKTRLFEYPCSYVIDTPMFQELPEPLKQRVIEKLLATLRDPAAQAAYPSLTAELSREILEILEQNHPEFFRDANADQALSISQR